MISYSARSSLFTAPVEYRLEGDELHVIGRSARRYRLADLRRAWFQNMPSQQVGDLQKLGLRFRGGRVSILSHSFAGLGSFEDRHESFDPFVSALLGACAREAPGAVYRKGYGALMIAVTALVVAMVPVLALAALALLAVGEWWGAASSGVPAFFFGQMAWSYGQAARWNWPGRFDPNDLAAIGL